MIDIRGVTHAEAERRCWTIAACPPGSTVRLRVDNNPVEIVRSIIARQLIEWNPDVRIVVEASNAEVARKWVTLLRGDE